MNTDLTCLEVRRRVGAEPQRPDAATLGHCKACGACRNFMNEMLALDMRLTGALAIEVPEELEARIVFRAASHRKRRRIYPWLAIAASLVLAVGLGSAVWRARSRQGYMPLATAVVRHVMNPREAQALDPQRPLITDARRVQRVLASIGARMQGPLHNITYAKACPLRGRKGQMVAHIVVRGKDGPVTVLLLPHMRLASAMPVESHGFHGMIVPAGAGSIAVVTSNATPVAPIARHFLKMVQWSR